MSEELFYQNQLQNLEDVKTTYFRQLDEVEQKRAEIALKKEEIKAEESLMIEEYEKIREAKQLISMEYEGLVIKNGELNFAMRDYEQRKDAFSEKENDLKSRIDSFEIESVNLEERKTRYDADLKLLNENEDISRKNEQKLADSEIRINKKINDLVALKKEISSHEMDIEVETEKIERGREYNKLLREQLSSEEDSLRSREHELKNLKKKTVKDIGKHMNIQRQHINIKKLNARIEQQFTYIKTLEDNVLELKLKLESANAALRENTTCSRVFEKNVELLQIQR
ncbi:hypothetical protein V7O66_04375 [Methanolobus sp. ZRKC3]|uniref:hypothetical protein n=1 Tax=Methanolobus sp. ZRKC3 TaxID=3125786 RepID=UPI00325457C7